MWDRKCHHCGENGYVQKNCPKMSVNPAGSVVTTKFSLTTVALGYILQCIVLPCLLGVTRAVAAPTGASEERVTWLKINVLETYSLIQAVLRHLFESN